MTVAMRMLVSTCVVAGLTGLALLLPVVLRPTARGARTGRRPTTSPAQDVDPIDPYPSGLLAQAHDRLEPGRTAGPDHGARVA